MIRHFAVLLLASALFVGCAGQKSSNEADTNDTTVQESEMVGAFSNERELQEEELTLFQEVYHGDVALTPKSVATQVVAGTNYRFRCEDAAGEDYLVTIFVPLPCNQSEQQTEVTKVEKVEKK